MAGRKIVDREDAKRCLAAVQHSGLSRRDWAREHGVDGRSLHSWRVTIERGSTARKQVEELQLVELVPSVAPPKYDALYVVRCGAFAVEVDGRFEDRTLGRLLRVVASC